MIAVGGVRLGAEMREHVVTAAARAGFAKRGQVDGAYYDSLAGA